MNLTYGDLSDTCNYCGEQVARVVELGIANGKAFVLPDDPVIVAHPDAPNPMHKRCAQLWAEGCTQRPLQVSVHIAENSVGANGKRMYFPADTPVTLVEDEHKEKAKEFREALESESERGSVLVACSWLDHLLEEMLSAWFPNKKAGKKLTEGFNSPLGTFSARVNSCYAIGLIAESEYRQLELLRKIRNEFAHSFSHMSFENKRVEDRVRTLPSHGRRPELNIRGRFESAVDVLVMNLRYRTDVWSKEPPRPMEIPWFYPLDESGAMKLDDTIELAVPLDDPWVNALASGNKRPTTTQAPASEPDG